MVIATLLDAILLLQQLAIYKCDAQANTSDPVAVDNARADAAAKLRSSLFRACVNP